MEHKQPQHSILDRTILTVFPEKDTASQKDCISVADERLQRLHGSSLIADATLRILGGPSSVAIYATACTMFHRYCHVTSLRECCVWSVAMAATFLAAKIEDSASLSARHIILAFIHIYQRRRLVITKDSAEAKRIIHHKMTLVDPVVEHPADAGGLSLHDKRMLLRNNPPCLSKHGPTWKEWHTVLVQTENDILKRLGFVLYWIPNQNPHRYLIYFLRVLEMDRDKELTQACWNLCQDSCRLDLCVHYQPYTIACAIVLVAGLVRKSEKIASSSESVPWWEVLCGRGCDADVGAISKILLAFREDNDPFENQVASCALVKSIKRGKWFLGNESYLWDIHAIGKR